MTAKEAGIAFVGFLCVVIAVGCMWGVGYVVVSVVDLIIGSFV